MPSFASRIRVDYREIAIDDIDQLYSWEQGWEGEFLQLSRGRLDYRAQRIKMPGLAIVWDSFGQHVLCRNFIHRSCTVFAAVLGTKGAVTCLGRDMNLGKGMIVSSERKYEFRIEKRTRLLLIIAAQSVLECDEFDQTACQLSKERIEKLSSACDVIRTHALNHGSKAEMPEEARERLMREPIVEAINEAIAELHSEEDAAHIDTDVSREFRLFKRAETWMDALGHESLEVGKLADSLQVSERAVYLAFQNCVGLGPYEYELIRRLHRFREAILTGQPYHGKVSVAARESGFQHMGRAASMYRRQFGETPRQTMHRRRNDDSAAT